MPFVETPLADLLLFEPRIFEDARGYFYESYNQQTFEAAGIVRPFVQDNQARSTYGVIRGLHYQKPPMAQAKLVRVLEGEVLDVVVDLRPTSATYGQVYRVILSAENQRQLYVPRGFAHGYSVLSPTATFFYKCDNFYAKAQEAGIAYNDATLAIDWEVPVSAALVSEKDLCLPAFGAHEAAAVHAESPQER